MYRQLTNLGTMFETCLSKEESNTMKRNKIVITLLLLMFAFVSQTQRANAQCLTYSEATYFSTSGLALFCENAGIINLNNYIIPEYQGGTFTGTGITNNQLDVSQFTLFIQENITYEVEVNGTTCSYNVLVEVFGESPELDPASININPSYCEADSPFLISPTLTTAGGAVVFINGVSNSIYDPTISNGNDTILITYGFGCFNTDTLFTQVIPTPTLNNPDTLFTDQLSYQLQATPAGGNFYVNATLLTTDIIDVSQLTAGTTIEIDYDIDGCQLTNPETITIAEPPVENPIDTTGGEIFNIAVFVPNIFTPNRDNNNDKLFVRGNDIFSLNFKIFNRWGEKVFETKNQAEAWEGFDTNGKELNAGVYFYQLLYTTEEAGAEILKKGEITLIR